MTAGKCLRKKQKFSSTRRSKVQQTCVFFIFSYHVHVNQICPKTDAIIPKLRYRPYFIGTYTTDWMNWTFAGKQSVWKMSYNVVIQFSVSLNITLDQTLLFWL